ncbi:sensor histidine kinase [Acetivibrio cellulolyticus]|uniref:sensor histidine kinase n=1 Tax=Acetivibrio cellulolyticus TaxID=35830 RepID=UPI0001E2DE84|nr:histidine kinase [Acetivibrio cellulolyticus]
MRLWRGLRKLWSRNKLKKRLITYFMATIVIMGVINIYPYYGINMLMRKMSTTFEMNVKLNNLSKCLKNLNLSYEDYLATKYSKSLGNYYQYSNELKKDVESINTHYSNVQNILMLKDIKYMISTYFEETDAAVTARRGRAVEEYLLHYSESKKIYNYINEYIQKLNNNLLLQNTDSYLSVKNSSNIVQTLNIGLIAFVIFLNIMMILWYTYSITKPISELSRAADEITHGNFDVPEVMVGSKDEIGVMAEAFNRMTESIRQYITQIKEKAELESRLNEREMENLLMKSNLREAELHALQAQINPHFLYNTLNTGAQLAMLEGADRACMFIENAAELFRYNIRNLDRPVTISEELKNIENYVHLIKVRFSDTVEFSLYSDESILNVKIPCMILQPIVENAFIHGIGDVEYVGRIWIKAIRNGQYAQISIKDNGKGMSEEKISEILNGKSSGREVSLSTNRGHTNGIGMNNILSRLKIFYNDDKIMEIYSEPGNGTEVILNIPLTSFTQEESECLGS